LKQNNIDRIEELLLDVSHPTSANYGKHWTPEEISKTFAPSENSIEAVKKWLHAEGFPPDNIRLSASHGWLEMNATVAEVERLLDAKYYIYSHNYGSEQIGMNYLLS